MWAVVYINNEAPRGWFVIDMLRYANHLPFALSGPHDSHADAVASLESMAWRVAQGWKP